MAMKAAPNQHKNLMIVALIKKYLILRQMDVRELAERVRMSRSTLYVRLNSPGEFRIDDLRRIASALGVTEEERHSIF